ncbi:MAG: hypothetical protein Q7W16_07250 [Coriobacteriia bacterium]|nr:hypothetical protein [Coriobacteriia bacterium]
MTERLTVLLAMIQDPAKNPTAAAVGIGIILVAFLLVGAALLAWALPRRETTSDDRRAGADDSPGADPRMPRLWAILATVIALAALWSGWAVTSDSAFCGRACHAMASPYTTWRASSHSATPCVRCHEGRSVLSVPAALSTRAYSLVAQITSRSPEGRSAIPAARCLECHSEITTKVLVSDRGVMMSHRQAIAGGATCDDCHGSQGHETTQRAPSMADCLRCHDGTKASAACLTCHRKPLGGLTDNDRFGKGRSPMAVTCGGCHSQAKCDACHGLRMPHPADYADPRRHARPAAFAGKGRLCYRCHAPSDCNDCHKPFTAHVRGWERTHRKYPRDTTWCRGCHDTKDMCGLCHAR